MSDIVAAKVAARQAAFVRREVAHASHRASAAAALVAALDGLEGRIVAGYLPIRTEADPQPAMTALARTNRLCVPVVAGPGLPLTFREWNPGCTLEEGPFKVQVPVGGADLVPDTLIVPLLAFDDALFRLGYGGGFYDRTLAKLRGRAATRAIGFAYADQRAEALPLEATDQPLDALVTEAGLHPPGLVP